MSNLATSSPPESLEDIIRRIGDVSTLPQIAINVMQVAKDPDSSAADLAAVIEGDPALSSKVLRTVNSAAYSLREKTTDLNNAISYLGFNQVRNIAMSASVSKIFKDEQEIGPYRRTGLWRHLVSVGLCARLIARRRGLSNAEDAFLCGLLHDLGIILEDQYMHNQFRAMMESLSDDKPLIEVELEHLGFDHTKIAHRMAKKWKFPEVVQSTIRFHHETHKFRGDGAEIVQCVDVANFLCTAKGVSSIGLKLVRPNLEVIQSLQLGREDLRVLVTDLDEEFLRHESLFDVL